MHDEIEIYEEYDVPTVVGSDGETASTVSVAVSGDRDAAEIVRALRREEPRVFVGAAAVPDGAFSLNPMCLTGEEADYVVERLLANV